MISKCIQTLYLWYESGQNGQGWSRQKDYRGSPEACWGKLWAFSCAWRKRGIGGQGSQGPDWPSLLQQEEFLRPPSLSSIPDTASNMNIRRHCFPLHRAICPGAKEGSSSLNLTIQGKGEPLYGFLVWCAYCSAQWLLFLDCFCLLRPDL